MEIWLLLFALFCVESYKFEKKEDDKVIRDCPLGAFNVKSAVHCAHVCATVLSCVGFNVGDGTNICELSACGLDDKAPTSLNNFDFYERGNSGTCSDGFEEFRGACYFFSPDPCTGWNNARQTCISKGADLVSIESVAEFSFLSSKIKDNGFYYTSGTDLATEGTFVWEATGQPIYQYGDIFMWGSGQPDNSDGTEHYLEMTVEGVLNDAPESHAHPRHFVCERQP